jgi:hypothetical protein
MQRGRGDGDCTDDRDRCRDAGGPGNRRVGGRICGVEPPDVGKITIGVGGYKEFGRLRHDLPGAGRLKARQRGRVWPCVTLKKKQILQFVRDDTGAEYFGAIDERQRRIPRSPCLRQASAG